MHKAERLRVLGLMVLTLGAITTWGKLLLQPNPGRNYPSDLLPKTLQLSGWTGSKSLPLRPVDAARHYDIVLDAREYKFRQPSAGLTVQLRYLFNTDGSLGSVQQQWLFSTLRPDHATKPIEQRSDLGYATLSSTAQETSLDTCLNPQGKNTVTRSQFLNNRLHHDLTPVRFLQWIIGQTQLLDKRCLWIHISIHPQKPSSNTTLYSGQLRQTWLELQPQLQPTLQRSLF